MLFLFSLFFLLLLLFLCYCHCYSSPYDPSFSSFFFFFVSLFLFFRFSSSASVAWFIGQSYCPCSASHADCHSRSCPRAPSCKSHAIRCPPESLQVGLTYPQKYVKQQPNTVKKSPKRRPTLSRRAQKAMLFTYFWGPGSPGDCEKCILEVRATLVRLSHQSQAFQACGRRALLTSALEELHGGLV